MQDDKKKCLECENEFIGSSNLCWECIDLAINRTNRKNAAALDNQRGSGEPHDIDANGYYSNARKSVAE